MASQLQGQPAGVAQDLLRRPPHRPQIGTLGLGESLVAAAYTLKEEG